MPLEKLDASAVEYLSTLPLVENVHAIELYERVKIKGVVFTTMTYHRSTATCSNYVGYRWKGSNRLLAVNIMVYCNLDDNTSKAKFFVGRKINLQEPRYKFSTFSVEHILEYEESDELVWGLLSSVTSPLFHIKINNEQECDVLSIPPNMVELNP